MATDEVVSSFHADLNRWVVALDAELSGLILCMIFQKKPSYGTEWIFCVCADGLDELTDLQAFSKVLRLRDETCRRETVLQIERISILRAYDPQTEALLIDIESVNDSRLLTGRFVFGRKIGRAQILFLNTKNKETRTFAHQTA